MSYCENEVIDTVDFLGGLQKKGSATFNSRDVQQFVGYAPGSGLANQIAIYETVTVCDKFEVTIQYEKVNSGGVADISVGAITGNWSIYDSYLAREDNDGMSCQAGWSITIGNVTIGFGTRYFSTYNPPVIYRPNIKFVSYTYTFNIYSTSYLGGNIQIGGLGPGSGVDTNLPDLKYLGAIEIVLQNSIE